MMFQRFSDQARRVVVLAQEEARMLNHNSIGTEHLLLGLIREDEGIAARALRSLGLDLAAVRQQVAEIVGQGKQGRGEPGQGEPRQGEPGQPGHIPFTPRAKKALELSLREALQLGASHIGTEHILVGLVRVGDGVAARVLVRLGADLHGVRRQVIQLLAAGLPADVIAASDAESRLAVLSDQVRQLSHEVERLRGLLRQHGLEPGEDTA
jgi:ATP-dependent Clp protease ATP-binding subunit ClpC